MLSIEENEKKNISSYLVIWKNEKKQNNHILQGLKWKKNYRDENEKKALNCKEQKCI